MTGPNKPKDYLHQGRHDRFIKEWVHDPYKSKSKLPEPTACPACHAVYHKGRWQWLDTPPDAQEQLCPACLRVRDGIPAGFLDITGDFLKSHREEILNLIHNTEAQEKKERPLERIMALEETEGKLHLSLTSPHITRGLGEALHHAYQGTLDFHYEEEDILLRVHWSR
ncbi:MAG: BCAM0308 family protein [Pseudomonadota bacterium]|nr:BCAM0308 family protein [Pseudomonadota bacterium]